MTAVLLKVIFTGKKSIHNLSDHHQRRIAGIIIYIFQTNINSMLVVIRKHLQVITTALKAASKIPKWNGDICGQRMV